VARSGLDQPGAILSKVDLARAVAPTRQTRSPAETERLHAGSSGVPPKVKAISLS